MVRVERDILAANDAIAERNREGFEERGIFALQPRNRARARARRPLLVRTIERLTGWSPSR
jgi:hypothetical protein